MKNKELEIALLKFAAPANIIVLVNFGRKPEMFVRLKNTYLQIVENRREGKKTRQRMCRQGASGTEFEPTTSCPYRVK